MGHIAHQRKNTFAQSYVYSVTFIRREKNIALHFENIISPRKILRKGWGPPFEQT